MTVPGPEGAALPLVTGWDLTAALALGRAAGVADPALAEFLPLIEDRMVRKLNEGREHG